MHLLVQIAEDNDRGKRHNSGWHCAMYAFDVKLH